MNQDEQWLSKYNEIRSFIEANKRNPSKYIPEERGSYLNWIKHNRKMHNAGKLKEERIGLFEKLMELGGDRGQVPVPILKISVLHTYSLILF